MKGSVSRDNVVQTQIETLNEIHVIKFIVFQHVHLQNNEFANSYVYDVCCAPWTSH